MDKKNDIKKPYVKYCTLIVRESDRDELFFSDGDMIYPYLEGYTILPTEQYASLKFDIEQARLEIERLRNG